MSFTILKNTKANNLKTEKAAKLYSHGTIFFSCSFLKEAININDDAKTVIPPSIENNANTTRALRTEKKITLVK